METNKRLMYGLGGLGLIPFLVCLLAASSGAEWLGVDPVAWFIAYGAVILSFLGGILWGRALACDEPRLVAPLLLLSNLFALLAWLGLLLRWYEASLLVLSAGFVMVLWTELRFAPPSSTQRLRSYLTLRYWLTGSVLGLHLLLLWQYR
ncbi:DUF3429 domain-containing protein [Aestuariirhabdus litorea]|nr:DUF3429 domain-containing protein [Aestuariirhabdus litorea]